MKLFKAATYCKPELLFRPSQIWKRLVWSRTWKGRSGRVTLPFGLEMEVDANDRIGEAITKVGLYDIAVLECLARLPDPAEVCLDVGANTGLMSAVMACAVGEQGRVVAFEPHPRIFGTLKSHVESWCASGKAIGTIECREIALSSEEGEATLCLPEEFAENQGTAFLGSEGDGKIEAVVRTMRLADIPEAGEPIGVLKIDVEGHELAVFEGAAQQLEAGTIRDIIFEGHDAYPTPVTEFLESRDYSVFLIQKGLMGPLLLPANVVPRQLPNYLATRDVGRATKRLRKFGYRVLRPMV